MVVALGGSWARSPFPKAHSHAVEVQPQAQEQAAAVEVQPQAQEQAAVGEERA